MKRTCLASKADLTGIFFNLSLQVLEGWRWHTSHPNHLRSAGVGKRTESSQRQDKRRYSGRCRPHCILDAFRAVRRYLTKEFERYVYRFRRNPFDLVSPLT
jgi:hypothetical protein